MSAQITIILCFTLAYECSRKHYIIYNMYALSVGFNIFDQEVKL